MGVTVLPFLTSYGYYNSYLIYILPAILISVWAQIRVKTTFSKYSGCRSALNGADAARRVLEASGVAGVRIEQVSGNLTDHFDPRTNTIRLSDAVYNTYSIAAVGVAAHEAGHAVQYARGYFPIKARAAILPVCQIGSQLSLPLLLIGILFNYAMLINLGIIFFCAALVFQIITLPVEFNASSRALHTIRDTGILNEGDTKGAARVLHAAAMTYVASVIVSVMQLLRLLAIAGRRK